MKYEIKYKLPELFWNGNGILIMGNVFFLANYGKLFPFIKLQQLAKNKSYVDFATSSFEWMLPLLNCIQTTTFHS
jgi:hypothetical protein